MPRKPGRDKTTNPDPAAADARTARQRIIDAFMGLLAEKPFEQIGLGEIASRAEVTLAELRENFSSTFAILAAQFKEIDRTVLAAGDGDLAEEPPRERLFDVLMRRLDALEPHKAAVRSLAASAMRDPVLGLALNRLAVRSQQWMLTAGGISAAGPRGIVRAQGLAMLFARVLRTGDKGGDAQKSINDTMTNSASQLESTPASEVISSSGTTTLSSPASHSK